MSSLLAINLLGSPVIVRDAVPVRGVAYTKARALVYYLAATNRTHTRETLANLLWYDVTPEQSKKNLRDILASLRRALAPYLSIDRHTVSLNPDAAIVIDSQQFAAHLGEAERHTDLAAKSASLRAAVNLYRGDFLDGFHVGQAPEFEEWMLAERERFRQLALHALHTLAHQATQQGDYLQGIDDTTRLLILEPFGEEAHRQLMLLLAQSGQQTAALSHYEVLRRTLEKELGAEPDAKTVELYEQIAAGEVEGRQPDLPAPGPTIHPRHNLPAPLTAFVGRETEVQHISDWLNASTERLLTLVGPGGVGKTTLALHAARQLLHTPSVTQHFTHGVFVVFLAALDPLAWHDAATMPSLYADALASSIADALGVVFSGPDTPYTNLINYLRTKQVLLVLDNFEHLLPAADSVTELLHQAPGLSIMVTSRSRLNVYGEHILELDGLHFPSNGHHNQAGWEQYSAIQLFQRSVQATVPRFVADATDRGAITRICQLLNGLPLGIELAASWVRVLPCMEVAREIETNLHFLQAMQRDIPERHQSLHAVFDHSWKLLSTTERQVLRRLSIFRGGFDRNAAAFVCSDGPLPTPLDVTTAPDTTATSASFLQLLAALLDNSLVRLATAPEQASTTSRYTLLGVVRQFAADKLAESQHDAEQTATGDRHCAYYLHMLVSRGAAMQSDQQQDALAAITTEIDNIRSAWRWAAVRGHIQALDQAMDSLFDFYNMRSWFREGLEAFALAAAHLAQLQDADHHATAREVWGKVLARQGWFTFHLGHQIEAKTLLEQSLNILREQDRLAELVFPLNYLAAVNSYLGDYQAARTLGQEGLAVSRTHNQRYGIIIANNILGQIAYTLGEYTVARHHFQESLGMSNRGDRWSMAFTLTHLGTVAYVIGDYREAQAHFQEALATREALGDARGTALCLNNLGDTAEALDDYDEAQRLYQRSLALFREIGNHLGMAASLSRLGYNGLATDHPTAAKTYFGEALQTALDAQAPPRMLDALVGIATLLVTDDPERALALATLVWQHPSATQRSRDRAAKVGQMLATPLPEPSAGSVPPDSWHLNEVVAEMLHTLQA